MEPASIVENLGEAFSLTKLFGVAGVLAVAATLSFLLQRGLDQLSQRFARFRIQIGRIFPVARLAIWVLTVVIIVFVVLDLPEHVILPLTASVGIAVGLAAQDLIKNLLAGIVMVFIRPFRLGDMVSLSGHYGEVIDMDPSFTRLRTFNDDVVAIPNAEVFKQAVSNANGGDIVALVPVTIHLPPGIDLDHARRVAREAAECCPFTFLHKPVAVAIEDRFAERHNIAMIVKAYVVDVRFERMLATDITLRIHRELSLWKGTARSDSDAAAQTGSRVPAGRTLQRKR